MIMIAVHSRSMILAIPIVAHMRVNLRASTEKPVPDGLIAHEPAPTGLAIAVRELTVAHLYAEASLYTYQPVLCESLPTTFKFADAATDPVIDVILKAEPALDFMVIRVQKDWRLLTFDVKTMVAQYDQGTCRVEPAC